MQKKTFLGIVWVVTFIFLVYILIKPQLTPPNTEDGSNISYNNTLNKDRKVWPFVEHTS